MVEEMKYVSIAGSINRMNHVIEDFLVRYDIQLEYAAKQLSYTERLQPFTGVNPYAETLHKAERLLAILGEKPVLPQITGERAVQLAEAAYTSYEKRDVTLKELEYKSGAISKYIENMRCFRALNVDLNILDDFTHISCNFGRIPIGNFSQFKKFLYDDSEIILFESQSDDNYVWCVYFTPTAARDKVNSIFLSLHFERMSITGSFMDERRSGTPAEIIQYWQARLDDINVKIKAMHVSNLEGIEGDLVELTAACVKVKELYAAYDVRKYAAVTLNDTFTFVGWMPKKDALALEKELSDDDALNIFTRSGQMGERDISDTPPTRLKNPPVIRLFEFFTRMYGLPLYGEMDPTPIMAVTYTLLFGMMFGDVGQGLCLALIGMLIYNKFKTDLGGIITVAGLSGSLFGFMYGSVFGLENILPALWRKPAQDINGMLFTAVGLGVGIILLSMALHIINSIRLKKWADMFFNPNGIAGMAFYGIVLFTALRVILYGHTVSPTDIALCALPLIFVAFREPLTLLIEGERRKVKTGVGMFLFGTLLELVEVLLSYITNTISFVRVGAFAISHAAIMSVVLLLSRNAAGTRNFIVIIVGNIVVMGIEGLLVGIQVLRLDFYEIFSRFYNGGGHGFKPAVEKNT